MKEDKGFDIFLYIILVVASIVFAVSIFMIFKQKENNGKKKTEQEVIGTSLI